MKRKAKRAGRPPLPEDERLGEPKSIKFTGQQVALIERAAGESGKDFAAFVRDAAYEKARRVLGEAQ